MTSKRLASYDHIVVAFSGGKDSIACVLTLLEAGAKRNKIELWHHEVDGYGEDAAPLMDWPCTSSYVTAFAAAFNLTLHRTWKHGGFMREMLRENSRTAPISFEAPQPDGSVTVQTSGGNAGTVSTRRSFPQVAASLTTRWCSAYLKIDNARTALRNQTRFNHSRTLFVSGERAAESPGRAGYAPFKPDDADLRNSKLERHIDRYRPVHAWSERAVWAIIERWRVNPHPTYWLGWSRCSCAACIFNGANKFASLRAINEWQFQRLSAFEGEFGRTIKRKETLEVLADKGTVFEMNPQHVSAALSDNYLEPIILEIGAWQLPRGAYQGGAGPT